MPGGNAGCETQLHTQIDTNKKTRCIVVVFLICARHKTIHLLRKHTLFRAPPTYSIHLLFRSNCCRLEYYAWALALSRSGSAIRWTITMHFAMATAPLKLTQTSNIQLAAPPHLPHSSGTNVDEQACSRTPSRIKKPAQREANPAPGEETILHQTCISHCKRLCEIITGYSACSRMLVCTAFPRTK